MMKTIPNLLQSELDMIHAQFRTVSTDHLSELSEDILQWKSDGLITEKFFQQNYGDFRFQPPAEIPDARSIIIIAIPQKSIPLIFQYKGKHYDTLIPPTYVYASIRATCQEMLRKVLKKTNHSVALAPLPLKLLAVRSGLGRYGRNNICYVDGMGSFVRLQGFYTDYEFDADSWQEKEMMKQCTECSLCRQACPMKCIPDDRVLIHADHCLTYLNENEGDFPKGLNPKAHHAIVGCMRCQQVCPQNKSVVHLKERPIVFSEEETTMILQKTPRDKISPSLSKKLLDLNLDEYYVLLSRNLSVLMK